MTDLAMPQTFQATRRPVRRKGARPGRPSGLIGALNYGGVLLVWLALFLVDRPLAMRVFAERRADSPIRRTPSW